MDQNFFFAVVGYLLLIGAMGFVRPSHDFQSGLGRPGLVQLGSCSALFLQAGGRIWTATANRRRQSIDLGP